MIRQCLLNNKKICEKISEDTMIPLKKEIRQNIIFGMMGWVFILLLSVLGNYICSVGIEGLLQRSDMQFISVSIIFAGILIICYIGRKEIKSLDDNWSFAELEMVCSKSWGWKIFFRTSDDTEIICPNRSNEVFSLQKKPDCRNGIMDVMKKVLSSVRWYGLHYLECVCFPLYYIGLAIMYHHMKFILVHREYKAACPHNAIIICPSRGFKPGYFFDGPELLVDYFLSHHIPYKVYIPQSCEEFFQIILNENARVLWLFGHGTVGSFAITLRETVKYIDLIGTPFLRCRKIAVHQLHCNGKNRESPYSLSRLLVDGWDFHEKGLQNHAKNRVYVSYVLEHHEMYPGIWEEGKRSLNYD